MPFVTCHKCDKESLAPRELVGLRWNCPKCQTPILVEDDDSTPVRAGKKKKEFPWPVLFGTIGAICSIGGLIINYTQSTREKEKPTANQPTQSAPRVTAPPRRQVDAFEPGLPPYQGSPEPFRERERERERNPIVGIITLLLVAPIYLAPTIVAVLRKHANLQPIVVVNVCLGCTIAGWAVALAWALTDQRTGRLLGRT